MSVDIVSNFSGEMLLENLETKIIIIGMRMKMRIISIITKVTDL